MSELIIRIDQAEDLALVMGGSEDLDLTLDTGQIEYPVYEGATEFTPTRETQTVETMNKVVLDNITINPIPQNYGLVTYQGNIITIS